MAGKRMSKEMREVHEHLLDRMRAEHARAPKSAEWQQLEAEFQASGIDPTDLGIFSSVVPTTFDYEAAARSSSVGRAWAIRSRRKCLPARSLV
jgi:hypothetical protein